MKFFTFFPLLLCVICQPSNAQSKLSRFTAEKYTFLKEKFLEEDTATSKTHGLVLYPMMTLQPETGYAFGLSVVQYFRVQKKDSLFRPSVLHPFAAFTLKRQAYIECPFQFFLNQEKIYLYGIVDLYKYPYFFFGIGNNMPKGYSELYDANLYHYAISALRKVNSKLYVGIRSNGNITTITKLEKGKYLDSTRVAGSSGCSTFGAGPMLLFDTRDNIFSSQRGSFIELSSVFQAKGFLSNFSFASYMLDARTFIPLYKTHVLALQAFVNINAGEVPFMQMAMLGGPKRMRGYYEGRYRDKNLLSVQAEYRSPLWKDRIGYVLFGGAGMVNSDVAATNLRDLHYAGGGGLRYSFSKKEKLHFRFDYAFSEDGHAVYLTLNEAF